MDYRLLPLLVLGIMLGLFLLAVLVIFYLIKGVGIALDRKIDLLSLIKNKGKYKELSLMDMTCLIVFFIPCVIAGLIHIIVILMVDVSCALDDFLNPVINRALGIKASTGTYIKNMKDYMENTKAFRSK